MSGSNRTRGRNSATAKNRKKLWGTDTGITGKTRRKGEEHYGERATLSRCKNDSPMRKPIPLCVKETLTGGGQVEGPSGAWWKTHKMPGQEARRPASYSHNTVARMATGRLVLRLL